MSEYIMEESREKLVRFLPDALRTAISSYENCKQGDDFKAYHTGKKAALAHIELLVKLMKYLALPDSKTGSINDQVILAAMMEEAQEVLAQYQGESGDE